MKKHLSIILAVLTMFGICLFAVPAKASAEGDFYAQVCVENETPVGTYYAYAAESQEELDELRWLPFPNTALGCSSYNVGVADDPNICEVEKGAIHILQGELAQAKDEIQVWRDAHDRVADNLVERNKDYAALRVRFMDERNKKNYWKQLYKELKNS